MTDNKQPTQEQKSTAPNPKIKRSGTGHYFLMPRYSIYSYPRHEYPQAKKSQ